MAEAIASTVLKAISNHLATLAYQKIETELSAQSQLEKLKSTLSAIKAVLLDAEEQQIKNNEVRDWLGKLKDAMYDADDVLDEYEFHHSRQQMQTPGSLINKVCRCFSNLDPAVLHANLGQKIKDIREELDEIAAEKSKFHFSERSYDEQGVLIRREQTHSFVRASDVIGRDKDKEEMINMLKSSDGNENVTVIPIVGIGGLGKTTLAQMIFNDKEIDGHFNVKIWVCVSEGFSTRIISQRIMEKISYTDYSHLDIDLLQILLRKRLNNTLYLLVLDDVWNEDRVKWLSLKNLLMDGAKGSKIVVTTRSKKVASMMGTIAPYNLKGLPDDDCLKLLLQWAFEGRQEKQYPNLVEIGKDIVKKCGGLPLAARTLGSLLYMKTDEREWHSVRNHEIWELEQNDNDILPSLRLTYDQMPSYLKQCFAFCSLFPKDSTIEKETLIHLWMAQGFLQASDESQLIENIGNKYFDELLSRSLFEDAVEGDDGEIISCRMHDLVHDLAQSVAGSDCSILTPFPKNFSSKVRHVSLFEPSLSENEDAIPRLLPTAKKLRTLYSTLLTRQACKSVLDNLSYTFKYLRILHLSKAELEAVPSSIGNLLHLRYFDLSKNSEIKKLPNSLCKLRNLQKLRLYACVQLQQLPKAIWKLCSLRHLEITSQQIYLPEKGIGGLTALQSLSIYNCNRLSFLPKGMQHVTALQVLRLKDCPKLTLQAFNLSSLTSLETLEIRYCSELDLVKRRKKRDEDVSKTNMKNVKATEDANESEEAEKPEEEEEEEEIFQGGFQRLRLLVIAGLPKLNHLPKGFRNASNSLQYLSIVDCKNFYTLPDWLGSFTSLHKVEVINCALLSTLPIGMQDLPGIQILRLCDCQMLTLRGFNLNSLTSLEILEIRNCAKLDLVKRKKKEVSRKALIMEDQEESERQQQAKKKQEAEDEKEEEQEEEEEEEEEISQKGFGRLRTLIIQNLPKLTTLPKGLQNAANSLQHLSIADCHRFSKLPDWLRNFTSLQKLEILNCPSFPFDPK